MSVLSERDFTARALELEWILCDVDGVLTDGSHYYDRSGHRLLAFNVHDGFGLKLAQRAGLKVGILSARTSQALERRAAELGLDAVMSGSRDKRSTLESFLERQRIGLKQVAFMGDDLPDLVVLASCGLSFAPSDAVEEIRAVVGRVTTARGGRGAVREMIEQILRARGDWDGVYARYTFDKD